MSGTSFRYWYIYFSPATGIIITVLILICIMPDISIRIILVLFSLYSLRKIIAVASNDFKLDNKNT